jgi:hypothetical protein
VLRDGDNDLSFVLSGAISAKRFADLGEPVRSIDHRHNTVAALLSTLIGGTEATGHEALH